MPNINEIDYNDEDDITNHVANCPYQRCAICSHIWHTNFETDARKRALHRYRISQKGKVSRTKSYLSKIKYTDSI